jgi:hypothetical protein
MTGTVATEVDDYARMDGRPTFSWVKGGSRRDQNHWMELTSKIPPGEFSHWRPETAKGHKVRIDHCRRAQSTSNRRDASQLWRYPDVRPE